MLRTQVVKLARATPAVRRSFSVASFRASEGDTGAPRSSMTHGDSWQKREQASETKYIRDKEMEALKRLKERLADQRAHLEELEKHINTLESERVDLDERSKK
ncbi:uncharacterized protein PV06_04709 [Exophiala oligosperma]|uniref:ATPase inhibitor, mitochondrial n=2 Tax=Chaetothyriales TaxID=34395 RepID=A0A0D2E732_9EURO|nr:uncharacterized protein PV06_04709 [Exophiala oligosperma]KAJ9631303.1 ATPase inhibitor [Knufia peltigerae]KIW43624.1 hypothetical protein PV06_04709 [Exophiala oligosperma]